MENVTTNVQALTVDEVHRFGQNIEKVVDLYGRITNANLVLMKKSQVFHRDFETDDDIPVLVSSNDETLIMGVPKYPQFFNCKTYLLVIDGLIENNKRPFHITVMMPILEFLLEQVELEKKVIDLPVTKRKHKCVQCKKKRHTKPIATWCSIHHMCNLCITAANETNMEDVLLNKLEEKNRHKERNTTRQKNPIREVKLQYVPPKTEVERVYRNRIHSINSKINAIHCEICGDTEEDGELVKISFTNVDKVQYLCEMCYEIQSNM